MQCKMTSSAVMAFGCHHSPLPWVDKKIISSKKYCILCAYNWHGRMHRGNPSDGFEAAFSTWELSRKSAAAFADFCYGGQFSGYSCVSFFGRRKNNKRIFMNMNDGEWRGAGGDHWCADVNLVCDGDFGDDVGDNIIGDDGDDIISYCYKYDGCMMTAHRVVVMMRKIQAGGDYRTNATFVWRYCSLELDKETMTQPTQHWQRNYDNNTKNISKHIFNQLALISTPFFTSFIQGEEETPGQMLSHFLRIELSPSPLYFFTHQGCQAPRLCGDWTPLV